MGRRRALPRADRLRADVAPGLCGACSVRRGDAAELLLLRVRPRHGSVRVRRAGDAAPDREGRQGVAAQGSVHGARDGEGVPLRDVGFRRRRSRHVSDEDGAPAQVREERGGGEPRKAGACDGAGGRADRPVVPRPDGADALAPQRDGAGVAGGGGRDRLAEHGQAASGLHEHAQRDKGEAGEGARPWRGRKSRYTSRRT